MLKEASRFGWQEIIQVWAAGVILVYKLGKEICVNLYVCVGGRQVHC